MKRRICKFLQEIDRKGWLLMLIGAITWSLTMIKSGLVYSYGMGFWGPNGHDGVWHIAIAKGLANGSWEMPIFSGEVIKNYHIGFDLLLAIVHKLTFIPIHTLYFQVIPPILALMIGVFVYKFVFGWRKSKFQALVSVFFVYFGSSFGWIVTLLKDRKIGGESIFWSQQSISTLVNPPFALSILLIFIGLNLLSTGLASKSKKRLMIATFIFGILVQIKVYAGILCLGGLLAAGVWRMIKREGISLIKVFTGAFIVSVLVFFPVSRGVGETIVFKPFWFLETMMGFGDRLGWQKYGEAMVNYKLAGNFLKGIPAYLVAMGIFWFGNLGTRAIKEILFVRHLKNYKKLLCLDIFIYFVIVAGILIPTFFIQSGTAWNTIQFMYYSLIFSGILAGVWLGGWVEKRKSKAFLSWLGKAAVIGIVVVFTLPTTIGTLWNHYLPSRPPAKISSEELEALRFLEEQPKGVVLTLPFDKNIADAAVDNPPRPLYLYESTAYVSAFSGKPVYMEDEVNLDITGYDWKERRNQIGIFLATPNINEARKFLKDNNINYIYWIKDLVGGGIGSDQEVVKLVFSNEKVDVYQVN
jgi:hypothetical protein